MKLIQISDCHLIADQHSTAYQDINPYQSLKQVLVHVNQAKPDLLIVSGDISGDDSAQSYRHFLHLIKQHLLLDRLLVIAGNHDLNPYYQPFLGEYDLSTKGGLTAGGWLIHGLDTRYKDTLGYLDIKDRVQLELAIDNAPHCHHLIVCHHHPIALGSWMDKHEWINKTEFCQSVARRDNIKAVIYGHVHHASSQKLKHSLFMSCPSTCWQWGRTADFSIAHSKPGWRVLELHDSGEFDSYVDTL